MNETNSLPALLTRRIDALLSSRERVLLAIEGGSASGKTTLASALAAAYACPVFHMDDFFLQPAQRTAERLAQPGGNVDRERFLSEVLLPLRQGRPIRYRAYDCSVSAIGPAREMLPGRLNVVEGAYSLHPDLADYYDLRVFLAIDPELQRSRTLRRNTPEMAQRFFDRWIPLEQRYFDALNPRAKCEIVLHAAAV